MEYDLKNDVYTCRNGKKLTVSGIRHSRSKTVQDTFGRTYKKSAGSQNFYEATAGRPGTDSVRGRYPVSNEPEYSGRRLLWRFKTGYEISKIFM